MIPLLHFWSKPLAHTLGWTLLHFCWQGAIIAVLLWCALRLLDGRSSRLRYLATCIALALTVLAPLATLAHIAYAQQAMRNAVPLPAIDAGMTLRVGADSLAGSWQMRLADTLDHSIPWIMFAWIAGVIFFLGRLHAAFLIARRMEKFAVSPPPSDLQAVFDKLCRRLNLSRPVRLLKSALVDVPTVIGCLRPVVLIPVSCFTGLSSDQVEAILSHELAHIRRHDYLVSVFQSIIEALLFYHPAVWWISRQVRRERECCCDDMAVSVGGDAFAYASALSHLEERRSSLPEVALAANGGVLTMRIKRLLGYTERSAASQVAAVTVLIVVLAAIIASTGPVARAGTADHISPRASIVELETPAPLNAKIAHVPMHAVPLAQPATHITNAVTAMAEPPAPPPPPEAPPASGSSDQIRVSAGIMQGALLYKADPVYPDIAKAAHVQGVVVLRAVISKSGTVESLAVISGPTMLQSSALDAVRQWKYKPYLLNGEPTEVSTTINVNYTFGGAATPPDPPTQEDSGLTPKKIGGNITPPLLIYQADPEYSEQARAAKFSGIVLVNLWVDSNGNPTHVHVLRGVGMGLDEKALEAVRQYRFKPALEDGKPVLVELNIEVNFKIFDPPKAQGQVIDRSRMSSVSARLEQGVTVPVLISSGYPEYSEQARKDKVSGIVTLNYVVDPGGSPTHVQVIHGLGHGLDNEAIAAVQRYRFKPAIKDGKPVPYQLNSEVNFQIF